MIVEGITVSIYIEVGRMMVGDRIGDSNGDCLYEDVVAIYHAQDMSFLTLQDPSGNVRQISRTPEKKFQLLFRSCADRGNKIAPNGLSAYLREVLRSSIPQDDEP